MLKPKTHLFKVKVMLNKLEAVNNKVASRCHAYLKICKSFLKKKTKRSFSRYLLNSRKTSQYLIARSNIKIIPSIMMNLQDYMKINQPPFYWKYRHKEQK